MGRIQRNVVTGPFNDRAQAQQPSEWAKDLQWREYILNSEYHLRMPSKDWGEPLTQVRLNHTLGQIFLNALAKQGIGAFYLRERSDLVTNSIYPRFAGTSDTFKGPFNEIAKAEENIPPRRGTGITGMGVETGIVYSFGKPKDKHDLI